MTNHDAVADPGFATTNLLSRARDSWHRLALVAILGLAGVLNLWALGQNGYANEYYSAAVRSMGSSWSNFFFVSFDPGGLVSVDKPPFALWVMAASAKVFGYSGWSIILPSALAGIAAVWVLNLTVTRVFGRVAGLVAALCLAVSPVSVAVNRDNNPDAIFALLLVLSAYAVVRALEKGSLRWLLGAGVFVGLAFNTKMLAAFIVLPALTLAYLCFAPNPVRSRLLHLVAAGGVLAVVSAAWVAAVELVPAESRPYVGSTDDNSALSLVLGYNGLGRITGQDGGTSTGGTSTGGGLGGAFSGEPGPWRLLNDALGEQSAWLLPLAIAGLASALVHAIRGRRRFELGTLVVLGGWFVTAAVVFSYASGIIHTYYLNALAPAIAALIGIGAIALWKDARAGGWRLVLPVAALVGTAVLQIDLLRRSNYLPWLQWLVIGGVAVAVGLLVLVAARLLRGERLITTAIVVGFAALLLAPAAWSRTTLLGAVNGVFPGAGPSFISGLGSGSGFSPMGGRGRTNGNAPQGLPGGAPPQGLGGQGGFAAPGDGAGDGGFPDGGAPTGRPTSGGAGMIGGSDSATQSALAYAKSHGGTDPLTLVVSSEQQAASLVIEGEPVASLGGFTGRETVLTPETLARLIDENRARYFLLGGNRGGPGGTANAGATLISSVCTLVPTTSWQDDATTDATDTTVGGFGDTSSATLYDCGGKEAELAAS